MHGDKESRTFCFLQSYRLNIGLLKLNLVDYLLPNIRAISLNVNQRFSMIKFKIGF